MPSHLGSASPTRPCASLESAPCSLPGLRLRELESDCRTISFDSASLSAFVFCLVLWSCCLALQRPQIAQLRRSLYSLTHFQLENQLMQLGFVWMCTVVDDLVYCDLSD